MTSVFNVQGNQGLFVIAGADGTNRPSFLCDPSGDLMCEQVATFTTIWHWQDLGGTRKTPNRLGIVYVYNPTNQVNQVTAMVTVSAFIKGQLVSSTKQITLNGFGTSSQEGPAREWSDFDTLEGEFIQVSVSIPTGPLQIIALDLDEAEGGEAFENT